jgi:hypothetical protein
MLQETLDSLKSEQAKTESSAPSDHAQIIDELNSQAVELETKAKELRNKIESLKRRAE